MTIEIKTLGTAELWERFQIAPFDLYKEVAQRMNDAGLKEKPSVSRVLEEVSPSEKGDRLDAFERLMQASGIVTRSDWQAGYFASNAGDFAKNPGTRALFAEFFARNWRKGATMDMQQRGTLLAGDSISGSWARPYAEATTARPSQQVAPAIPLSELVALTTPIDSDAYRAYYLTYDATKLRQYRVGESADIPIADLVGGERTISLKKYGRGIRATYENLRRMRVDKLAWYIQWMAVQSEIDKVAGALDVIVSGDGNSGTAATNYNLTTLDSAATAGTLTLDGWLAFKMKFVQPYMLTTVLQTDVITRQLARLNTGSANIPLVTIPGGQGGLGTGLTPINQFADGVRYGWTSDAPANKIVGFDKMRCLEHVIETGSEISEMERYVVNQTEVMVMSVVEGFAILDSSANKILTVNA